MGKFNEDYNGFSAVETLLTLVFIALVVLIGLYVYHNHNSTKTASVTTSKASSPTNSSKQVLSQTYIDTSGWFTLKYPATWDDVTVQAGTSVLEGPSQTPTILTSNAAGQLEPSVLKSQQVGPILNVGTDTSTESAASYAANTTSTVSQGKSETINGYPSYYDITTSGGETNSNYIITHNGKIAILTFTLKDGNNNYTSYVADEAAIAGSIQFSN